MIRSAETSSYSIPARRRAQRIVPCLLASVVAACFLAAGTARGDGAASEQTGQLVPAALGIRTDRQGNSWSVESNGTLGRIGSTMVNSGLALSVNGERFVVAEPLMTADAKEFVLPGRSFAGLPGLQAQRRIRLMEREGYLRYLEILRNESPDPMTVHLSLLTNFSGNFRTFLTDRGRTEPILLEPDESGVVVLPGASQSTRAYLFTLSGRHSGMSPSISSQNRYGLTFQYSITLQPGETRSIAHHVAQVAIPGNFDRRSLLRLFRPYALGGGADSIPTEWRGAVANLGPPAGLALGMGEALGSAAGLESLGLEPGGHDVLAAGEGTKLSGSIRGGPVGLVSDHGEASFELSELAAIAGPRHLGGGEHRLFLRDGQVLGGRISAPGLGFDPLGGGTVPLDLDELDRLVFATPDEIDSQATPSMVAETYGGDRLRLAAANGELRFEAATPWGELPVSFDELLWLAASEESGGGYRLALRDGMNCFAFLGEESVVLPLEAFGAEELPVRGLRRIVAADAAAFASREVLPVDRSVLRVGGGQTIVGEIGDTALPILSEGLALETATSEIRSIVRLRDAASSARGFSESTPSFEIERWDGGVLTGLVPLEVLSIRVAGRDWKVPLRDIESIRTPSPDLRPEDLATILQFVENLSSPDWATREKATRELGGFGHLAASVLRRELRSASDPETIRRLERILAGLN